MSALQHLQSQLAEAMRAREPSRLSALCGDAAATREDRFAIYRHGYRVRLREALRVEFPGLVRLAAANVDALLDDYVNTHPSTHFNIRWHGAGLAQFLTTTSAHPAFADMAALDWAISTAYDGVDHPVIDATALASVPADQWATLRFHIAAGARVVTINHNVDAFRRAADRGTRRPSLRRLHQPRHLLVWRNRLDVHYRRLPDWEHVMLEGALRHDTVQGLCERLAGAGWADAPTRFATALNSWLADGLVQHASISG